MLSKKLPDMSGDARVPGSVLTVSGEARQRIPIKCDGGGP